MLVVGSAGAGNIYATFATSGTAGLCWDGTGASLITDCSSAPTDLAENFGTTDTTLVAGDLVIPDVTKEGSIIDLEVGSTTATTSRAWVLKASGGTRKMLLGVVSTNPNQVYGDDGLFDPSENPLPITLVGRVPVNVALTSEPIAIGDMITVSSDSPGKAEKATTAGVVIGTALSSYDPNNPPSDGKVLVFINVGWFDGGVDHNSFFSMVGYTGTSTPDFNLDLGNSLDSENILRAGNLLSVGADTVTLGVSDTSLATVNGFVSKTRVAGAGADQAVLSVFGGHDGITARTAPYLTVSSGQLGNTTADVLVVDHSGNVGIGTSTPAWKLNIATKGQPQLALTDMDAGADKKHGLISFIGGIFSIGTQIDALTSTSTSATSTLFTISDTGRVGVGTTTPERQLSVSGSVGFDGLTTGFGAGSLCLSSDGEVVYNSGSDSCLPSLRETKHSIASLSQTLAEQTQTNAEGALALVNELVPVSFIYNEGDGRVRYGFIAEDSALVDKGFATYDAEGNITGVDDRALISLSIKALQELAEKNKTYETYMTDRTNASTTDAVLAELELGASSTTASSTVVVTDKSLQVYDRFVEVVRSALSKLGIAIENGVVTIKNFATDMFSAKYAIINDLTVDALTINDKLCVDDVCLDKEQLRALLEERGGSSTSNNQITSTSTQTEVQNTDVQSTNSNQSADIQTTQTSTTTEPAIIDTTASSTPETTASSTESVVESVVEEVVVEEVVVETTPTEEPAPEPVVEEPVPTE